MQSGISDKFNCCIEGSSIDAIRKTIISVKRLLVITSIGMRASTVSIRPLSSN